MDETKKTYTTEQMQQLFPTLSIPFTALGGMGGRGMEKKDSISVQRECAFELKGNGFMGVYTTLTYEDYGRWLLCLPSTVEATEEKIDDIILALHKAKEHIRTFDGQRK